MERCWEQMERFTEEYEKYNIAGVIPYAEAILEDWQETHQEKYED